MKKILLVIIFTFGMIIIQANNINAQTGLDLDSNIGLEPISVTIFPQVFLGVDQYYTVYSWVSFAGVLASFGIVAYWIFIVLKAAFNALKSEGDSEKLEGSYTRIKSTIIGASIALAFPILISIFGAVLGLGPMWSWPKAFRDCPNSTESSFYFQEVFRQTDAAATDPVAQAESVCY